MRVARSQSESHYEEKNGRSKHSEYLCGEGSCSRRYHSYTAFYNHCKRVHEGNFPKGSLLNGQPFEGPTKNRGRPRIKKSDTKNEFQIESMKAENDLIEFLGTIAGGTSNEEMISHVENPSEHLQEALTITRGWVDEERCGPMFQMLQRANEIICRNDLPQFYDPVEYELYADRVDSYSFVSIFKFFKKRQSCQGLKEPVSSQILLLCWLSRILSLKLLSQTIYTLVLRCLGQEIHEKDLYKQKSCKFLALVDNYLGLVEGESAESDCK